MDVTVDFVIAFAFVEVIFRYASKARQQIELFEKTFQSQNDAIFILDAQKPPRILDVNKRMCEIFGYKAEEVRGRTTEFLYSSRQALLDFQAILYPAIEKQGYFDSYEYELMRKDGTPLQTEHSIMPLLDEEGTRIGWVSVVKDITRRKQAEQEKDQLVLDLQDALSQVKMLGGLLPICAYCKRIRGKDGNWSEVEEYIEKKTEATFSHCYCPECTKKHHPEVYERLRKKGTVQE